MIAGRPCGTRSRVSPPRPRAEPGAQPRADADADLAGAGRRSGCSQRRTRANHIRLPDAFYVTTPIYYVNDAPHIGHAYHAGVRRDRCFARLDGRRVRFLTGTDEHGQKVEKAAAAAGKAPQAFTDEVSERFRDLARRMRITNDDFIAPPSRATGSGCRRCGASWWRATRSISAPTPAGIRCAMSRSTPRASWSTAGRRPSARRWNGSRSRAIFSFLRVAAAAARVVRGTPRLHPAGLRRNEVVSFVEAGCGPVGVAHSFAWGVPVPDDPKHVVYVWLDALTNYMTALGYPDRDAELYRTFWPADVHVVGKDTSTSTRCSGRRSCSRPGCSRPSACSPMAGGPTRGRRSRNRSAT